MPPDVPAPAPSAIVPPSAIVQPTRSERLRLRLHKEEQQPEAEKFLGGEEASSSMQANSEQQAEVEESLEEHEQPPEAEDSSEEDELPLNLCRAKQQGLRTTLRVSSASPAPVADAIVRGSSSTSNAASQMPEAEKNMLLNRTERFDGRSQIFTFYLDAKAEKKGRSCLSS